jgi:hypothetical protein
MPPVVIVNRPNLTPEEERKALDNFAKGLGDLLHCKVTITKKEDGEE